METDYKIIANGEANDLIHNNNPIFIKSIDFNSASVYQLESDAYLITPPLPYYSSLIVYNEKILNQFIENNVFPNIDSLDIFYINNRAEIKNINKQYHSLIDTLLNETALNKRTLSLDLINEVLNIKANKKITEKDKLKLIALVGAHIMNLNLVEYKWALHKQIGGLNPTYCPILVDMQSGTYLDIYQHLGNYLKEVKMFSEHNKKFDYHLNMIFQFSKRCRNGEIIYFD